jgi:hypothetical protein
MVLDNVALNNSMFDRSGLDGAGSIGNSRRWL